MYTKVNPNFTIYKWGLRRYTFQEHVFLMNRENVLTLVICDNITLSVLYGTLIGAVW